LSGSKRFVADIQKSVFYTFISVKLIERLNDGSHNTSYLQSVEQLLNFDRNLALARH